MDDVRNFTPKMWAVVDLDTGTVLGTNVVLVAADGPDTFDGMTDAEVHDYAVRNAVPLLVDTELERRREAVALHLPTD